jgi:hypothetical protein
LFSKHIHTTQIPENQKREAEENQDIHYSLQWSWWFCSQWLWCKSEKERERELLHENHENQSVKKIASYVPVHE